MKKILSTLIVVAMLALPNTVFAASAGNNSQSDCPVKNVNSQVKLSTNVSDILKSNPQVANILSNLKNGKECNLNSIKNSDFFKNLLNSINSGKASTGWTGIINTPSAPEASKPTPSAPTTSKPSTTTPPASKPSTPASTVPSTSQSGDLSAYVNEVVRLVNEQRAANGLSALTADTTLMKAAGIRAQEITKSFSHTRPNGTSTFTVLNEVGASYRGAGENIAMGQSTPAEVMNGWMNSPGHRANILNSSFTKIGVGVYKDASGRLYWTQMFTY